MTENSSSATAEPKRQKAPRLVKLYDRRQLNPGDGFRTTDGHTFGCTERGNFVRTDKDTRSPKERKRQRRLLRATSH